MNTKQTVDPGPGYRLLKRYETIQAGDQFLNIRNEWKGTDRASAIVGLDCLPYRRKLEHWWPGKDCKPAESLVPTSVSWVETPAKAPVSIPPGTSFLKMGTLWESQTYFTPWTQDSVVTTRKEQFEKEEAIKYLNSRVAKLQKDRDHLAATASNFQDENQRLKDTISLLHKENERLREETFGKPIDTCPREDNALIKLLMAGVWVTGFWSDYQGRFISVSRLDLDNTHSWDFDNQPTRGKLL